MQRRAAARAMQGTQTGSARQGQSKASSHAWKICRARSGKGRHTGFHGVRRHDGRFRAPRRTPVRPRESAGDAGPAPWNEMHSGRMSSRAGRAPREQLRAAQGRPKIISPKHCWVLILCFTGLTITQGTSHSQMNVTAFSRSGRTRHSQALRCSGLKCSQCPSG